MSFLLKDAINGSLVDAIFNEVISRRSNYFYFIGKVLSWPNPQSPPAPEDTLSYELETRNEIISIKKIQSTDVSYVIPRINWEQSTVYDQYDGDYYFTLQDSFLSSTGATSLKDSRFYALTSNFNVYKCLFNNNGLTSTVQPTGTEALPINTGDGYVWKYMYTIPLSLRNRFLTDTLMPVQKSVLNTFYSNGEIDNIIINNVGSGYLGNSEVTLEVNGTFKSNVGNVIATLTPVFNVTGSIVDVKIRNAGNNYSSANITITDNAGTGVSFYKNLVGVNITNPGSGYNANVIANTIATISTSGTQPTTQANVVLLFSANAVVGATIVNAGNGYTPSILASTTIAITTSGNAQPSTNATALLSFATTARLTPILLNGAVDRVIIEDQGFLYRSNVQTIISTIGDGSNVSLLPFINEAGEMEDVIILSRGEGFTFLDIEVIGDGIGANASAQLSEGDLNSNQSTVELAAIPGALYAFRILNRGSGFSSNTTVSVIGDGTGFVGNVVLTNDNTISFIQVNNPGSGYSYANVIITGSGANAIVEPIISPQGGHGSNSIKEFFADSLLFFSTINNERIHGVDVNNDYRQFGIIKNLKQFGNFRAFANATGTPCFLVTTDTVLNSLSLEIAQDTILVLGSDPTRKFEVVEVTSNNKILLTNINNYDLEVDDILTDTLTNSNFTIEAINNLPTINKFSGDLLFIDNRTKVSYSDQQLVTLRTTLKL